jgi:branched-chain amino acid transport system substrate-binding protein
MRWIGLLIAVAATAGALTFAGGSRASAADPYEINVILSLTGPGSFLGKNEASAVALVEQNINKAGGVAGRPIKFVVADDQSSPAVDVQLANALIAKNVPIILGPSLTAGCNAITAYVRRFDRRSDRRQHPLFPGAWL